jgi:hypothetical protein
MIKLIQIHVALGLLLLAAFVTLPVSAETNLIQDGGFEVELVEPGDFKLGLAAYGAWTSPAPGDCAGSTEILGLPLPRALGVLSVNPLPAYEGDEAMNLGPCFGRGSVSQVFATTIGATYRASLAVIGGTVTATVFNANQTDLTVDFVASERNVWGTDSHEFTATHTTTTITVQNTSPRTSTCCAPTIDDVRIFSVVPGLK